jgi:DNA-binding NarL/FixJ family response regulator
MCRDAMVTTFAASGIRATSLPASSIRYHVFDVLVMVEPRKRDWELLEVVSPAGVVVVDDRSDRLDAALAGADAVIGLDRPASELIEAIRTVAAGGAVLDAHLARAVVEAARSAAATTVAQFPGLTARESEVLRALSRGESTKQTARALTVSVKTVDELQRRAFRKLGARNRAHAVALLASAKARGPLPDVEAAASV